MYNGNLFQKYSFLERWLSMQFWVFVSLSQWFCLTIECIDMVPSFMWTVFLRKFYQMQRSRRQNISWHVMKTQCYSHPCVFYGWYAEWWSTHVSEKTWKWLAVKWGKSYSEVMGWISSRLSFAILRATLFRLWGSHAKWRGLGLEDGELIGQIKK